MKPAYFIIWFSLDKIFFFEKHQIHLILLKCRLSISQFCGFHRRMFYRVKKDSTTILDTALKIGKRFSFHKKDSIRKIQGDNKNNKIQGDNKTKNTG